MTLENNSERKRLNSNSITVMIAFRWRNFRPQNELVRLEPLILQHLLSYIYDSLEVISVAPNLEFINSKSNLELRAIEIIDQST